DENAEERVKNYKAQTLQIADLGVTDVKVAAERAHHHAENLTVDEGEDVGDHQHADYIPDVDHGTSRLRFNRSNCGLGLRGQSFPPLGNVPSDARNPFSKTFRRGEFRSFRST